MKKHLSSVFNVFQLFIGTALTALSFGAFILPLGYAAGGVTGFSKTLCGLIPLPLSLMVLIINMTLLLLGYIILGKGFVMKTITVSVLFPVMLDLFSAYPIGAHFSHSFVSLVCAGLLLGTGAGLIIRSGASSGGFDILALILNSRLGISVALVLNLSDAAVILMQAVNHSVTSTLCGILVITISAAVVGFITALHPLRIIAKLSHA